MSNPLLKLLLVILLAPLFSPGVVRGGDPTPPHSASSETLIKLKEEAARQELILNEIKKITKEAESSKKSAEKQKRTAQAEANKNPDDLKRLLANYRAELETYRAHLAGLQLELSKKSSDRINNLISQTEEIGKIASKLTQADSAEAALVLYQEASDIWRSIIDNIYSRLFETTQKIEIPPTPTLPSEFQSDLIKNAPEFPSLFEAQKSIELDYVKAASAKNDLTSSLRKAAFELLLKAGKIRSEALNLYYSKPGSHSLKISEEFLSDLWRELKIVPYRFLAMGFSKLEEIKNIINKENKGIEGILSIIKQLLIFLIFISIPFILFALFKRFSSKVDSWRRALVNRSSLNYRTRTSIALWVNRINHYIPWIFIWATLRISDALIKKTTFSEIRYFLPYIEIYIYYRVFRLSLSSLMARLLLSKNLDLFRTQQARLLSTSKRISVLLLIEWITLHATQDAVRKALIYHLISQIVVYLNLLIFSIEAKKWKTELLVSSKEWMPSTIFGFIEKSKYAVLDYFVFPLLLIASTIRLIMVVIYHWFSRFEIGKRVSAEILKRKLEDATEGSEEELPKKLPESYLVYFSPKTEIEDTLWVNLSKSPLQECLEIIDRWEGGKTNNDLLVISGDYGMGKSALLRKIQAHPSSAKKIYSAIEKKITTKTELYRLLSDLLGFQFETEEEFLKNEKSLEKTILILDDVHNLFLAQLGGFDAYRALVSLVNLQLENILCVLSLNKRSYDYLKGVFGEMHFLGVSIEMKSWSDSEIQDLIMKRHETSGFQLIFDRVISAIHKEDLLEGSTDIEAQFFRLLWGQSRGNPLTAEALWLSATKPHRKNTIQVGVPEFPKTKALSEVNDESLLIYSTLIRHGSLSLQELQVTSRFPISAVSRAIKFGEDHGILAFTQKGTWRVHPKTQNVVHSFLVGKNFIYE